MISSKCPITTHLENCSELAKAKLRRGTGQGKAVSTFNNWEGFYTDAGRRQTFHEEWVTEEKVRVKREMRKTLLYNRSHK